MLKTIKFIFESLRAASGPSTPVKPPPPFPEVLIREDIWFAGMRPSVKDIRQRVYYCVPDDQKRDEWPPHYLAVSYAYNRGEDLSHVRDWLPVAAKLLGDLYKEEPELPRGSVPKIWHFDPETITLTEGEMIGERT